jgi:hypothetical protein
MRVYVDIAVYAGIASICGHCGYMRALHADWRSSRDSAQMKAM